MNGYQTPGQVIAEAGGAESYMDGLPLRLEIAALKSFSAHRVGREWSQADHDKLAKKMRQIDELAAALARVNQGGPAA